MFRNVGFLYNWVIPHDEMLHVHGKPLEIMGESPQKKPSGID